MGHLFISSLGSPNVFSHASTCFLPRNIGWWLTVGYYQPEHDFENARFIMLLGRDPWAGLQLGRSRIWPQGMIAGLASWFWILASANRQQ